MRHTHLVAIGTALPEHRAAQRDVGRFMQALAQHQLGHSGASSDEVVQTLDRIDRIYARSGIDYRHSVIGDYLAEPAKFEFFPRNWALEPFPTTAARMALYRQIAPALGATAAERCLAGAEGGDPSAVTHLILVSCTGFFAPGPDVELVERLGLSPRVRRTVIGFMGCYAAFNAVGAADSICRADPAAVVLVVCVELCTLHFQRQPTANNIVANALFADGAAAALLTSEPTGSRRGLVRLVDGESCLHGNAEELGWTIGDTGFEMTVGLGITNGVRAAAKSTTTALLDRHGLKRDDVDGWAIHPGGRRIVDAIQSELGLDDAEVAPTHAVLRDHGNMSSATILFVLDELLRAPLPSAAWIVAMGFGPGLTAEGLLLSRP